jgi:zinc transporter, ZIP family
LESASTILPCGSGLSEFQGGVAPDQDGDPSGGFDGGFWGFVGGAALLVGAPSGLYAGGSQRVISVVMAFGAGVLISSVAFELMEEAYRKGGFDSPAIGVLLGALAYFAADLAVSRHAKHRKRSQGQQGAAPGPRSP